jgi:hypothetical protein
MSKSTEQSNHKKIEKRTCQGGKSPKTSSMSKNQKRSFKLYRRQGK